LVHHHELQWNAFWSLLLLLLQYHQYLAASDHASNNPEFISIRISIINTNTVPTFCIFNRYQDKAVRKHIPFFINTHSAMKLIIKYFLWSLYFLLLASIVICQKVAFQSILFFIPCNFSVCSTNRVFNGNGESIATISLLQLYYLLSKWDHFSLLTIPL
jgi:hypothetical protein